MSDIDDEVRAWLHTQQDWLQEAADRLLKQGNLDDKDITEVYEQLKTSDGRKITGHREFKDFTGSTVTANMVRLESIGKVQGIENLVPRAPLTFGVGNLVVVYGNNGSGKSGYTRILKRLCGKPGARDVEANIFQAVPDIRQCQVCYSVDDNDQSATWSANSDVVEDLRSIDIFDGDIAGFYLGGETEASYTPPIVSLFESLASVCEEVTRKIGQEQRQQVTKLPLLPVDYSGTKAGKYYSALRPNIPDVALKPITEWTGSHQKALEQIIERLKTDDPAALAKRKRARLQQINEICSSIDIALLSVSDDACKQIQLLNKDAKEKRQQAIDAAKINTSSAILDGIGTETWIAMWNAARTYSTEVAYPQQQFPVTEEEARCVLCHQELDEEAGERLKDLEEYVQGKMESEAQQAEKSYEKVKQDLPQKKTTQEIQTSCRAAGLDDSWHEPLTEFWNDFGQVREKCVADKPGEDIQGITSPTELLNALDELKKSLEKEVIQHDADAIAFNREEAEKTKLELEAKLWTSQQADAIRAEVERLTQVKTLGNFKSYTNSRNISLKAGEISEKVITEAYVFRFNEELKKLGAKRISVDLIKTRTEKGRAKHRLQLRGVRDNFGPDKILSDGERRAVALAAFLADVTGKPQTAPFVFDDPISSLDQDFEWEAALRLATLAQDRQVIVFTHRLSLYGALEDAARKQGEEWKKDNLAQLCIESFAGTAGHPVDEAFWNTNTKKANNILINRLNEAKKHWDAGDADNYRIHAQGICTDFRKLLERTVEEDLLSQIVKRHRRSVTTDNRISNLPKITKDDCDYIDEMMTKYSTYEHSQSHEAPAFLPAEPDLRQDIEALKAWRDEFCKRPAEAAA